MKALNSVFLWARVPSMMMEGGAYLNSHIFSSTIRWPGSSINNATMTMQRWPAWTTWPWEQSIHASMMMTPPAPAPAWQWWQHHWQCDLTITCTCTCCHDCLTPDQVTATPVASQLYSSIPVAHKHFRSRTRTLGATLGLNSFLIYYLYYTSLSTLPWPCYVLRSPSPVCVIYLVLFSLALVLTFLRFSFVRFFGCLLVTVNTHP